MNKWNSSNSAPQKASAVFFSILALVLFPLLTSANEPDLSSEEPKVESKTVGKDDSSSPASTVNTLNIGDVKVMTDDDVPKSFRQRKFLVMTVGVEQDEKLGKMPESFSFRGDFKKIAKVSYSKDVNSLRFIPVAEGVATLTIVDRSGKILNEFRLDIKKSRLDATYREIQSLLNDIEGIQIKIVNNKIVIDGQVLLTKDLNRIHNVLLQFGDQASSLVTLSPLAMRKIAEFVQKDINNPDVTVRTVNDKILLEGMVNSEDEKAKAELVAKMYAPALFLDPSEQAGIVKKPKPVNDGIVNLLQIKAGAPPAAPKTIQLVVHYVELKRDYARNFKFQFTPGLTDGSSINFASPSEGSGGVSSTIMGTISSLIPKLNWAKQHGHARVLESTSLIVEDGKTGSINATTDFPFIISGPNGQSTQFKKVGINSSIKPVITGERGDMVKLMIQFAVDSLVGITASGPLTSQNQVTTEVSVRSGQSAAIGGLIRSNSNTGYNRPSDDMPKNPIISLYASKEFSRNQTQFVVFVTPIIKSSASSGSEKVKQKFRIRD